MQNLCCIKCGCYMGRYLQAATIIIGLYCKHCKGHCVLEAQQGELVGIRFEPKRGSDASESCVPSSTP